MRTRADIQPWRRDSRAGRPGCVFTARTTSELRPHALVQVLRPLEADLRWPDDAAGISVRGLSAAYPAGSELYGEHDFGEAVGVRGL